MLPQVSRHPRLSNLAMLGAVAGTYFALCRLGYHLAIPPNQAVGVWPASGFALAATLTWGPRAAWGVWLGHWTFAFLGYLPGTVPLPLTWIVPLGVATGSALQSLAGRWLVQRLVGYPNPLAEARAVLAFFGLASPLACWIAPTFGTTTLIFADRISMAAFIPTWWTWWLGDVLGILLVAPVCLLALGLPREAWRARRWRLAPPLGLALGAVLGTFLWVRAHEARRIQAAFEAQAQRIQARLAAALGRNGEAMETFGLILRASGTLDGPAFQRAVAALQRRAPALQSPAWLPTADAAPAPPPDPTAPSDPAAPSRALAAEALQHRAFCISRPHGTRQGTLAREELLLALPVPERNGVLVARVAIPAIWSEEESLLGQAQGLHVRWSDATDPREVHPLVAATARRSAWIGEQLARPATGVPYHQADFHLGGRSYRVEVWPTPMHLVAQQSRTAWTFLTLGCLFCATLAGMLLVEGHGRERAGEPPAET